MNIFLKSLKIFLLTSLIIILYISYHFYDVWNKDERAQISNTSFSSERVTLGEVVTLRSSVRLPWHRELISDEPIRIPESLVTTQRGFIQKGSLDFKGYRHWDITIQLIITGVENVEGKVIDFKTNSSTHSSPSTVNIPIPPLEINIPDKSSDSSLIVSNSSTVLEPVNTHLKTQKSTHWRWWPYILVTTFLIVISSFLTKKWISANTNTPPWVIAQRELKILEKNSHEHPAIFYTKLTDILKKYTSQRFQTSSDSATAPEFTATLQKIPYVNEQMKSSLTQIIQQADSAKFASAKVNESNILLALTKVNKYIKETIPSKDSENKEVIHA